MKWIICFWLQNTFASLYSCFELTHAAFPDNIDECLLRTSCIVHSAPLLRRLSLISCYKQYLVHLLFSNCIVFCSLQNTLWAFLPLSKEVSWIGKIQLCYVWYIWSLVFCLFVCFSLQGIDHNLVLLSQYSVLELSGGVEVKYSFPWLCWQSDLASSVYWVWN